MVIKTPHAALIKDAEFAARFRREIRSLVQLTHANIVKVMDVGVYDGLPFAVMQYLPGGSVADMRRLYAPAEILEWLGDIADALDFMNQRGFIHRDVKPANILLDDMGRAYLGDFGIAKVVAVGEELDQKGLTGTQRYDDVVQVQINEFYREYDAFIVIFSESETGVSQWSESACGLALTLGKHFIPVAFGEVHLPFLTGTFEPVIATDRNDLNEIARAINERLGKKPEQKCDPPCSTGEAKTLKW